MQTNKEQFLQELNEAFKNSSAYKEHLVFTDVSLSGEKSKIPTAVMPSFSDEDNLYILNIVGPWQDRFLQENPHIAALIRNLSPS